ncbi:MAG: tetratricopeptide repeat protein [Planctomycetes bacterium]|nr:tetratricopeptide repeat protein [Planctomycetota bacterium]
MNSSSERLKQVYARLATDFEVEVFEAAHRIYPNNRRVLDTLATAYSAAGLYASALKAAQELVRRFPGNARFLYNLACSLCNLNRHDEALKTLEEAVELGFTDFDYMARDPDLAGLRKRPEYHEFERRARSERSKRLAKAE